MRNKYPQEFKDEAVRQVLEQGHSVVSALMSCVKGR